MKIDYSIKPSSRYFLFLDVPFRQGINHIYLGKNGGDYGLDSSEKIKHIFIGTSKLIPIVGHAIALVDKRCQRKSITCIKLTAKKPFQRGEEHGLILKRRIKEIYDPILYKKRNNPSLIEKVAQFERQIPASLKEEMQGLAKGSGYPYEDVLLIHAFLDAQPGRFGCTSMAIKETHEKCERIAAANHHLVDSSWSRESQSRRQAFLEEPILRNGRIEKVLKSTGKDVTIQSMVFDTAKGEIYLSSKATYAANRKFKKFGPDLLFDSHKFSNGDSDNRVRLLRNLDWPWHFLGQETVLLTRSQSNGDSTVSVSWPGYIGTLSGMNNSGLAVTQNQADWGINLDGIPNPLLFTHILDTCKNMSEASEAIEKKLHGSSMNVVIADKTSAKSYELGEGCLSCVGEIN